MWGFRLRVWGSGFGDFGWWFQLGDLGVQGSGVQGLGFRV